MTLLGSEHSLKRILKAFVQLSFILFGLLPRCDETDLMKMTLVCVFAVYVDLLKGEGVFTNQKTLNANWISVNSDSYQIKMYENLTLLSSINCRVFCCFDL